MEPDRRSIRLPFHDYTTAAVYFVTMCAFQRLPLFGDVVGDAVRLSPAGRIVQEEWERTAEVRQGVAVDSFVVMPNHVHGILWLGWDVPERLRGKGGGDQPDGRQGFAPGSLGSIVAHFKAGATRRVAALQGDLAGPLWQRNYYERLIGSREELQAIRGYILLNPTRWQNDPENIKRTA